VHVRFQQQQQRSTSGIREQHDVADAAQRSDKFRSIVLGQDRPVCSLELSTEPSLLIATTSRSASAAAP
jgi:hypothetical protein